MLRKPTSSITGPNIESTGQEEDWRIPRDGAS